MSVGEYFRDTWFRVNPNYPIVFMSDKINEENEEGNSDIGMFKVQVCDAGTSQKPFLKIWSNINT